MDFIKNTLKTFFINYIIRNATVTNVKLMFEDIIAFLRKKAQETDTELDDWFLDALESITKDEDKIQKIVDFIQGYLVKTDEVCKACPTATQYMNLAKSVCDDLAVGEGGTCKSIPWMAIKQMFDVLTLVLPYAINLINFLALEETTESTETTETKETPKCCPYEA